MRCPVMALAVVLMLVGPAMLAIAQPVDDLSSDSADARPTLSQERVVTVEDIVHYLDDQDGDELLDAIQIVTKLVLNRTGDYIITTKLAPRDGAWWLSAQEPFEVADDVELPDERYFASSFEGWKLYQRKVNGFLVVTVEVTTAVGTAVAKRSVTLDEQFQYPQFEPLEAGARVTGFGTPVKLDFDGNERYEIVEIPVLVDATTPGLYRLLMLYQWWYPSVSSVTADAPLRAAYQSVINETTLRAGTNVVPMWVSGAHLRTSDNITVSVYIYKTVFAGEAYKDTFQILDKTEFEAPTRVLSNGVHSEGGRDTDGDRLFDLLHVRTGLDVTYPGDYTLTAVILPPGSMTDYASAGSFTDVINRLLSVKKAAKDTWKATLGPGRANADFYFDGHLINAWGYDGTFEVHVFWTGPAPFIGYYFKLTTIEFKAGDFVHPVPPMEFAVGHSDKGVSKDGGELYDGLKVTFNVFVNTPGRYTAFATLYHDGKEITYSRAEVDLGTGSGALEMVFPGQAIYLSRVRGSFDVIVWVQGAGYDWNDTTLVAPMTAKHTTAKYSYEMFQPPIFRLGPKDPQPVEDLDFILLRTGILTVRIDRTTPDLTFYRADDEGRSALFKVVYTRLLAFEDENGDGAPQGREVTYTSALWSYDWTMSPITLYEDTESGRVATFSMTTVVDLVEHNDTAAALARPLSTVKDFAEVTLTFTLAANDMNHTDEVGTYLVLGGTEVKVDINIDVLTPVDGIDFLTIEQTLRDDRGAYAPDPDEANGNGAAPDVLRRYRDRTGLRQVVEFRQQDATPGFYSWLNRAEVTMADGGQEVVDVLASYFINDDRMTLYLSYPYDVNTTYIYHDPSLGIFEGDLPIPIPDEWKEVFDPLLYGMAAVAAVAVVYGLRGRPRRPEEDDLGWEDDVPMEPTEPTEPTEPKEPEEGPGAPPSKEAPEGIEELPDEPVENSSSTILMQPPPVPAEPGPRKGDGWVEWQE